MLVSQRLQLAHLIHESLCRIAEGLNRPLENVDVQSVLDTLDPPRQPEHGDLATNAALRLARGLGLAPPQIGGQLAAFMRADPRAAGMLADIDVAGPGFVNFRLTHAARAQVLLEIAADPPAFGLRAIGPDAPHVLLEFVSANPTGPLHVGHGRQAALGDTLAAMIEAAGCRVSREFYYNDAGAQIQNLALSVQARARGVQPDDPAFPADGYRGDYIADIARAYLDGATASALDSAPVVSSGDIEDIDSIRRFAVNYLRHEQDLDLRAFGVSFDRHVLESGLYTDGRVAAVVDALIASGHTYEQDGALWLRSTSFGDDKDRVMRKTDGSYTYFVPDVAYHVYKWERGFSKAINIQGSDHHGTLARVRAGLQALGRGIPEGFPDVVFHKMVTVMRHGQEVKISKRAGSYVTLRDLISWSGDIDDPSGEMVAVDEQRGRDAVRFFLVSRKAEAEFVFDIDLALSRSDDNPVYYIQYAHARICSVLTQASSDATTVFGSAKDVAIEMLSAPREQALLNRLGIFPDVIADAAQELSPHLMAFYLRDLAADFHAFYNSERVLVEDGDLRSARLLLLAATARVLQSGLGLLGVSAPSRM